MKKRIVGVVLALMCSVVLISMLSSCDFATRSKALVIKNNSGSAITKITISQFISASKGVNPNALVNGETIADGSSKTFYIAPYAADKVSLRIEDEDGGYTDENFTYDYYVNHRNKEITATYDGDITMSGSNVAVD